MHTFVAFEKQQCSSARSAASKAFSECSHEQRLNRDHACTLDSSKKVVSTEESYGTTSPLKATLLT